MTLHNLPGRAFAAAALTLFAATAACAAYPDKPVTLVVPYSAGGGADNAARIIAQGMSELSGQSMVIENKGGASGAIGAAYVARARPDGYTVLYDASSFAINPALRQLPYDSEDLVAVSQAISVPNILVVATDSPFHSLDELLALAKAAPGRHTYASYGPGSLAQMAAELLKADTGVEMVHVPYKGGAPALMDVMTGQVDAYFANAASSLNYVTSQRLRAIAVSTAQRMPELPDVPTVAESGIADFDVSEWNGFFVPRGTPPAVVSAGFYVPRGTPPEVVSALQDLVQATLAREDVRERLAKLGLTPVGSSAEEFARFVADEQQRWREVVEKNGISAM